MGHKTTEIVLSRRDRAELEALVGDGNTAQKLVKRARIVLLTADGLGVMAVMRVVGVSKTSVWRWQRRFVETGVNGLVKGRTKKPGKPLSSVLTSTGTRAAPEANFFSQLATRLGSRS